MPQTSPTSPSPKTPGLIAVMGATGAGKSSFVNSVVGGSVAKVEDTLESSTTDVAQYAYTHRSGTEVRVFDTPGFNDYKEGGSKTDLKVLQMIAAFLKKEYDANRKFSGIIFLHDINTSSVDWRTQTRNMALFKRLCGPDSMKNVVVVTTFWDQLASREAGVANEEKLKVEAGLLKELRDGGSKFVRYGHFEPDDHPKDEEYWSPHQVVDHLLGLDPVFLDMQKELADGSSIAETAAGSLLDEFKKLRLDTEAALTKMNAAIATAGAEGRTHRDELNGKLSAWGVGVESLRSGIEELGEHRKQVSILEALVDRKLSAIDSNIARLTEELDRASKERQASEGQVLRSIIENGLLARFQTSVKESVVEAVREHDESEKLSLREQIARLAPFEKMYEEMRKSRDDTVQTNKGLLSDVASLRQELHDAKENSARLHNELEGLRLLINSPPNLRDVARLPDKPATRTEAQQREIVQTFSLFSLLLRLLTLRYWISPSSL